MRPIFFMTLVLLSSQALFANSYICERAKKEAGDLVVYTWHHHIGKSCEEIIGNIEKVVSDRAYTLSAIYGTEDEYSQCHLEATLFYFQNVQENLLQRCEDQFSEVVTNSMEAGYRDCWQELENGNYTGIITDYPEVQIPLIINTREVIEIQNNQFWFQILQSEHDRGYFTGCTKAEVEYGLLQQGDLS